MLTRMRMGFGIVVDGLRSVGARPRVARVTANLVVLTFCKHTTN
jgi:hypothetical protein